MVNEMISSVALWALAHSEISMHNLRRYALEITETITSRTLSGGHCHAISSSEALSIISDCKVIIQDVRLLTEGAYNSLCEFGELSEPSDDEADTITKADVDNVLLCANSVADDIKQLSAYLKMVETTPAWKPHSEMLRTLEKDFVRELSRLRNTLNDTAIVMKQYLDSSPPAAEDNIAFSKEEITAFRDAVSSSHAQFGMEPPKWL